MSRGRRETLMSFTTLLVLGSMTMRLLVFSLLTKIRPVSLACAGDSARTGSSAKARLRIEASIDCIAASVRPIKAHGQAASWGPHGNARQRAGAPARQRRQDLRADPGGRRGQ